MAARVKVVVHRQAAIALLTSADTRRLMATKAAAIRSACNSQSSFGGYQSDAVVQGDRAVGRVWSITNNLPDQHNRHQRMIRNLDAGS